MLPRFGCEERMKILCFPRFQNEESIEIYNFLVSNTREVCHYLKCQKYINIQSKNISVQKVYQIHQYFKEVYKYLSEEYIKIYKKKYINI